MASLFPVHIHIHLRKADSICCCFSTLLLQNLSTTFTLEENRHLIHSPHSHLPTSSSSPNNTLHWSHHGSGTAHFLFHRSLLNTFWKIFFQFPIENFLCYSIFQELFLILWMVPYFVSSFFLAVQHTGSWLSDQGSNLCPLQWKCGVLTTRLPRKSL